ncbi:rhoptry neck protein RON1 [Cyclospora cayetanensis]|uniref:Rhoptry neck protein RON1 n=1 Tax=Cyclospora cayetanensis TaxID=88456 RepID=A0A1D3CY22_9EIME|nr:rhoptry neck protein RON1 [Cyclospora cayetanensis]
MLPLCFLLFGLLLVLGTSSGRAMDLGQSSDGLIPNQYSFADSAAAEEEPLSVSGKEADAGKSQTAHAEGRKGVNAGKEEHSTPRKAESNKEGKDSLKMGDAGASKSFDGSLAVGHIRSHIGGSAESTMEDLFGDIIDMDHPVFDLKVEVDPAVKKLNDLIFHGSQGPDHDAIDLMEASLDIDRLARGFDIGEKATGLEGDESKLFDSLPEDETPEALRGIVSLEEEGIVAGHLLRLWQGHRRLGLSLRDALVNFEASIERERTRNAAIAAVMGVHKIRQGVVSAKELKVKAAEAKAELKMLRKQHKFLGKQRKRMHKMLEKQGEDPSIMVMQIENMWAPVDEVAAFDPGQGSSFLYSTKIVGMDAEHLMKTCGKLKVLLNRITEEVTRATPAQLTKEQKEEEELLAVLDPDTGPVAALSSESISALSQVNPTALQEADFEFLLGNVQDHLREPKAHHLSARPPMPPPSHISPNLSKVGDFGSDLKEEQIYPSGHPAEVYLPFHFGLHTLPKPADPETSHPSVIDEEDFGMGLTNANFGSFVEIEAKATPIGGQLVQNAPHLSSVVPHDNTTSASFVSLGSASEEAEEAGTERQSESAQEGEPAGASLQASASEKASAETEEKTTQAKDSREEGKGHSEGSEGHSGSSHGKENVAEIKANSETASGGGSSEEEGGTHHEASSSESGGDANAGAAASKVQGQQGDSEEPRNATPVVMVSKLEENACEVITDPVACMQKSECFQDFIYGVCFFNCTTAVTPEDCEKHKFCRFETKVPHNACINEGYQTTDAVIQKFEGIIRGCEHFTKKETCDWMHAHGLKELEERKANGKPESGKIPSTAHLGPSPYHCQWMPGPSDDSEADVGGASVCGNLREAPSAERLLWGTIVAEKEKKLREMKEKENFQQGDICVRPSDTWAVLQPDRPFYSTGSIVKFSCPPGSVLLGVSDEIECTPDGIFEPALSCVEENDLSEAQLRHLRRKTAVLSASEATQHGLSHTFAAIGAFLSLWILA